VIPDFVSIWKINKTGQNPPETPDFALKDSLNPLFLPRNLPLGVVFNMENNSNPAKNPYKNH